MKNLLHLFLVSMVIPVVGQSCTSMRTAAISDTAGNPLPNSIAALEKLKLGGVEQFILMRGHDVRKPVLLRLHGGPGQAEIAAASYNRALEENFIVVEWEQRGAGKSYAAYEPESAMNLQQILADTFELTEYLRNRFQKRKIILMGHSWGSILGLKAIREKPQLYHALFTTGQIVSFAQGQQISYDYILQEAARRGDKNAAPAMAEIGRPPFDEPDTWHKRGVYFSWLEKLNGTWHSHEAMPRVKLIWNAEEYSLYEMLKFPGAAGRSFKLLLPDLQQTDFFNEKKNYAVPVVFFLGRHDFMAPSQLAEKYFNAIQSPRKELIWFENSAHFPQYEEPEQFNSQVLATARTWELKTKLTLL